MKFSGAEYDGIHEPIIDEVTFYKTQKEIAGENKAILSDTTMLHCWADYVNVAFAVLKWQTEEL